METIAISKFKATCLAVLERVQKTHQPVLVTRFGKPMAEVVPPPTLSRPAHWIGSASATGRIVGDILAPANAAEDWNVLKR